MTVYATPLSSVRPSQLYINAEKLADVLQWFDPDDSEYEPLTVFEFDGEMYLTDGHTRAFAAYLTGCDQIRVERDDGLPDVHDIALYQQCIEWCEEEGVDRIADLTGRVLPPEAYEEKWIDRCERAADRTSDL